MDGLVLFPISRSPGLRVLTLEHPLAKLVKGVVCREKRLFKEIQVKGARGNSSWTLIFLFFYSANETTQEVASIDQKNLTV